MDPRPLDGSVDATGMAKGTAHEGADGDRSRAAGTYDAGASYTASPVDISSNPPYTAGGGTSRSTAPTRASAAAMGDGRKEEERLREAP